MTARTVYLETFGCQMNELDSELVMGQLRALGYAFSPDPDRADVVLYNTCSVRDHAEQKVRSRLGELKLRKQREPGLIVGVLGCMAERDGVDMFRRFPAVDILCGPGELDKLPALLDNAVRTRAGDLAEVRSSTTAVAHRDFGAAHRRHLHRQVALQGDSSRRSSTLAAAEDSLEFLDLSRAISASDHNGSAYVRITRGCNKFCTYCVVPRTRGAEIHRPPDHIVDECKRLADAGVVEVTLLGQTVNHYRFEHGASVTVGGVVQPQKGRSYLGGHRRDPFEGEKVTTFAGLLRRIHEEVPAIQRLRFVTSYPRDFGDDVLEVMRDSPRICRYLHAPAQSGSNEVLRRMNRGYTVDEYLEFIDRARAHLDQPEIGRPLMIAGDMIVGFCGETDEDFQASVRLLERVRYKNCFIFKYSPRPGTSAFERLPDDVPDDLKRRRCNELLAVQHRISDEISRSQIGRTVEVFVEGVSAVERKRRADVTARGERVGLTVRGIMPRASGAGDAMRGKSGIIAGTGAGGSDYPVQMTGRTEGDLIVLFECPVGIDPVGLIGRSVFVRIDSGYGLTLSGSAQLQRP